MNKRTQDRTKEIVDLFENKVASGEVFDLNGDDISEDIYSHIGEHYTSNTEVQRKCEEYAEEEIKALLQEINRACEEYGIIDDEGETPVFSYWSERKVI
jgi:Ni,Fe-hydrogenase maturation factor